jgi:hypothetical protein
MNDDKKSKQEEQGTRQSQLLSGKNLSNFLRFGNVNKNLGSRVDSVEEL